MSGADLKRWGGASVAGVAMGFCLSRMGFSDFGEVSRLFALTDLRLLLMFVGAVAATGAGCLVLRSLSERHLPSKRFHRGTIPGALLFGIGWAVTGACPAVVFIQIGEGKLPALFTLAGMTLGVGLFKAARVRWLHWDMGSCDS